MDLRDIQNLIRFVAKSGASEVKLEMEDVKITIKTNPEEGGKEQVFIQQVPAGQPYQMPVAPLRLRLHPLQRYSLLKPKQRLLRTTASM